MMENIRLIFVLPEKYSDEHEVSDIMSQAYEACRQNVKTDVTWIKENDFSSITINKTDFVIFEDFKGEVFENLKDTKCARILGPWAISICLMEGKPIPNFPWPIYNVAMYECIVTCSSLSKVKKMEIKEKVQDMGGCYLDTLVEKITHLVTDTSKSEKYLAAAEAGVKLMRSSWIDAVWEASQSSNIHANDPEFEEHKCLPFQNLNISSTGLANDSKGKELLKLIRQYGGNYSAKLKLADADILVCAGPNVSMSEKYKAARKRPNIRCVDVSWITESVSKGYSLPHNDFLVKKATSTPNKNDSRLNPDFSVLSAISVVQPSEKTSVDATLSGTMRGSSGSFASPCSRPGTSKRKGNLENDYAQLVDNLDIKKAKRAGHYLDGCSVYITGFGPEHTEKLNKILNLSGATRYDQFSDRVTHVIVGNSKFHEVKIIKSKGFPCALVSIQWLLDSIESEQPVNEEKYLLSTSDIDKSEFTSPLSRKGLNLLRTEKTIVEEEEKKEDPLQNGEDVAEHDIIQQYLKPTTTGQEDTLEKLLKNADFPDFSNQVHDPPSQMPQFKPSETSTQQSTTSVTQDETTETRTEMFFEGLKFMVIAFEDEHLEHLRELIEGFSGELVSKSYRGIADYIVVPAFNSPEVRHTATEIVNELFINECVTEGGLLSDICYYHRPIDVPETNPLKDCVITISGYSSYERTFLRNLVVMLGGYHQEQFSRVTSAERNVVASTHLISDKPSGKKYQAALKWKLPAVSKDWLLECVKTGCRVPEWDHGWNSGRMSENTFSSSRKTVMNTPSSVIATPKIATPKIAIPKIATPKIATPKIPTPKVVTSEIAPPKDDTPTSSRQESNHQLSKNPSTSVVDTENTKPNTSNLSCFSKFNTPSAISMSHNATPDGSAKKEEPPSCSKSAGVLTPVNQILRRNLNFDDSPDNVFSQATPVNKILMQYRRSNAGTPGQDSPEQVWMAVKTPETPLGACLVKGSPPAQLRKECEVWLRRFPDYEPPLQRRLSTPLSEIKRKMWDKVLKRGEFASEPTQGGLDFGREDRDEAEQMAVDEPAEVQPSGEDSPHNKMIHNKLLQMEEMLSASGGPKRQSRNFQSTIPIPQGNREYKNSQPCTVGWDFTEQEMAPPPVRIFILTGVAESDRPLMVQQVESLGATVSDLSNYDPSGTHLLCTKPARNEKTLSFMAAGKWILHISYLEKSLEAGHFLDEEEFEFGNPKAVGNFSVKSDKETDIRIKSMHWWRKEVSRRGYGAFNDMRAIVVAQKRDPIVRVIEAGGGIVVDIRPPFDDTVHATHCLLEQRSIRDFADYVPLAQQGIYLLNTIYISEFLHHPNTDVRESILPYFVKYYSRS